MKYTFKSVKKAVTTMFNSLFIGLISVKNKSRKGHGSKLFKSLVVLGVAGVMSVLMPHTTYGNLANPDGNKTENAGIKIQEIHSSSNILSAQTRVISSEESVKALKSDYPNNRNSSTWQGDSAEISAELVEKEKAEEPNRFQLKQNYPNPFNPATEITYKLPVSRHVVLKVYDMLGRPIKTLVDDNQEAGNYTIRFNAGNLSSGMYIYRLEAGNYEQIRKMILIK
jgi:cytoskeletal protein RodZ